MIATSKLCFLALRNDSAQIASERNRVTRSFQNRFPSRKQWLVCADVDYVRHALPKSPRVIVRDSTPANDSHASGRLLTGDYL